MEAKYSRRLRVKKCILWCCLPQEGYGQPIPRNAEFLQDFSCKSATFVLNIEMTSEHPKMAIFLVGLTSKLRGFFQYHIFGASRSQFRVEQGGVGAKASRHRSFFFLRMHSSSENSIQTEIVRHAHKSSKRLTVSMA